MSAALLDHLWQSTLFGVAVWAITLTLRSNSAAVRHWLWLLASVKFLVPFSALYLLGAAAGFPTTAETAPPFLGTALAAATPVMSPTFSLRPAPAEVSSLVAPALLFIWGVVAAGIALRWLRGWRAADLLSRAARPAPGALPDARVTDADIEPAVARVFHPVVLLPSALLGRLTASQLDAVMTHEREHIARHDNLKAHIHRLVETLFWFHPLVWFISRQLREERERACDEAVLDSGHDADEYAGGILAVCRHCATVHSTHAIAAIAGDLTQRIRHILSGAAPASLGFIKAFALSIGAFLLAVAPLVAGALDDAERQRANLRDDANVLWDAELAITPASRDGSQLARLTVSDRQISIRNSSLRELIALAYDVDAHRITARGDWFELDRYDIQVTLRDDLRDPEAFSPLALRTFVNKLLASHFNVEVHVNHQCQQPCGWRGLSGLEGAPGYR